MNRAFLVALTAVLLLRAVAVADFASEMMEATFKLDLGDGDIATCFLVRREMPDTAIYLVTAAHAFADLKAETAVLVLRKPKADGSYERHDYTLPIRRGDKPLWVRHEKHDVVVLRLPESLPVKVSALPSSVLADQARLKASAVHLCSALFILAYPQRLEANESGIPVARQGIFASPPLLPLATHPTFLADYNAFPGDSGGPVFIASADSHPLVVGLVTDQRYHDVAMKSVYQEHSIRTPLGIVVILHAQYVRDTLEKAAKQNEPPSK